MSSIYGIYAMNERLPIIISVSTLVFKTFDTCWKKSVSNAAYINRIVFLLQLLSM